MAELPTNYLDDILAQSMNGKRKYRITRADGTFEEVILEDVSEYEQVGSNFGAGDINKTNKEVNELFQSVSDGKALVASAITDMGVATDATATFATIANNVKSIKTGVDTSDATAVASHITQGYTAYVKGNKIAGTRPAPVTKLSGTFDLWIPLTENVVTKIITFSTPFDKIPTVTVSIDSTGNQTTTDDWKIESVTRSNFKFSTRGKNWKYVTITVSWVAEA